VIKGEKIRVVAAETKRGGDLGPTPLRDPPNHHLLVTVVKVARSPPRTRRKTSDATAQIREMLPQATTSPSTPTKIPKQMPAPPGAACLYLMIDMAVFVVNDLILAATAEVLAAAHHQEVVETRGNGHHLTLLPRQGLHLARLHVGRSHRTKKTGKNGQQGKIGVEECGVRS
jgi:hypothetical protein